MPKHEERKRRDTVFLSLPVSLVVAQLAMLLVASTGIAATSPSQTDADYQELRRTKTRDLIEQLHSRSDWTPREQYILLLKIDLGFRVLKEADRPEAKEFKKTLDQLRHEHPEFLELKDFSMPERPGAEPSPEMKLEAEWKNFKPSDARVMGYYSQGRNLVVIYQYRIEFRELPPNAVVEFHSRNAITVSIRRGGQEIPVVRLPVTKRLTFRERLLSFPLESQEISSVFLVCGNGLYGYVGADERETELIRKMTGSYTYDWENKSGDLSRFCGVISANGKEVFRFPAPTNPPDFVLGPLGVSSDGKRAAVYVGRKGYGEDGVRVVTGPREVLVWSQDANRLERHADIPPNMIVEELRRRFLDN